MNIVKPIMASELFLSNEELEDALSENSFTIIKEPMGSYLIGYPYNKRFNSANDVVSFLSKGNRKVSKSFADKVGSLDTYGMLTVQISGSKVEIPTVNYLYSIPSYAGGGE